ncbi:MAG: hypothetical protein Q7K57_02295, partial [Burkholderiaceae bacterium]|nr:hypothetical protein [Burkholderiaceae bacterium]
MQQLNHIDIILWRTLAIFLLIGALMGIAVSLLLIFKPHLIERVNRVANRWISMRHISRWMDRSIRIERWCYRHHRPLGLLLTLGGAYILVYFGWRFDKTIALQSFSSFVSNKLLLDTLLQALVLFELIGSVFALLVGLVIWLRPSLLRGLEKESNQWLSLRRATKVLDVQHDQVDLFVEGHAQRVGWLLLVGNIYLFFAMI